MAKPTPALPFPIEAIAVVPAPGLALPNNFQFSQDDRQVSYLFGEGEQPIQQLYALDIATGAISIQVAPPDGGVNEANLSPEEELRRQRQRSLAVGLTQYSRAEQGERILVPLQGDIYVQDGAGQPLRKIVDNAGKPPAITPTLSPDGHYVAYVQDGEIYAIHAEGGNPWKVTRGARETGKTNGLAEYIAQEELNRGEGFWWSPEIDWIAYEEVDEAHIPLYRIMHQGKDSTGEDAQEAHRYPFAGAENARVRLGVVERVFSEPRWMDLDVGEETYLARVFWRKDGSHYGSLCAVLLNRLQNHLWLLCFDVQTGKQEVLLEETSDYWITLHRNPLRWLEDGSFLWESERSGFRHLYYYAFDGTLIRQLTAGEWMVDAINGVDEERGLVYFTANRAHPTEAHLYAVPLEGGEIRQITTEPGTHSITMDHACQRFVDVHSALDTPPSVTLRSVEDGSILQTIHVPTDPRIEAFKLEPPEIVSLQNANGDTLYGALYRPPAHFGPGPHPTIVEVYGGPTVQLVANKWDVTAALQLQYLRNLGFLVFRLDGRGSTRRGLKFEGALRHRMGTVEVEDQVAGARWLMQHGLADPQRVGVKGWSYGGYMTLMCLAKAPDVFKVGVSGAPVTAWDGYDTCYTERYMSTPAENPAGYAEGNVMHYVQQIRGKLLLVHGMLDENVHFRHTARLINALTRARKTYDLLIFPDERHMPRRLADRVYLNEQLVGYFQRHL
jgi:dipeptidyl-peptidase-4